MKFSRANLFTKPKVKFSDPSAPVDTESTHLSPSAMVARRFFRNKLAMIGLIILSVMFLFSFLGGFLSPYGESQVFEGISYTDKTIATVFTNEEYRFYAKDGQEVSAAFKSKFLLAVGRGLDTFDADDRSYRIQPLSDDTHILFVNQTPLYIASKDVIETNNNLSFDFFIAAFTAISENTSGFAYENNTYAIEVEGDNTHILQNGTEIAVLSRLVVRASDASGTIDSSLKTAIFEAIESDTDTFAYDFGFGTESLGITKDSSGSYSIIRTTAVRRILVYEPPSTAHWLGTDANGMDIFTRLIYGGRISLSIGFVVIAIEILIGILLGGIAGYFGGFFDALIMRIVDIFNCIPTWPIIIIIGALMDSQRIDPKLRIYYLMLVLGLLGWPGMARMIRGQILSLREQEFMIATEATGLRVSRRIFRHLVPNVIPQLIVMATMGLGSIILTESTLSFLGLGVKFPYASWGNIIQAVTSVYVMTNYPFVWIPAGFLILITVLGFNFAGDGLRDAFDPRMKR